MAVKYFYSTFANVNYSNSKVSLYLPTLIPNAPAAPIRNGWTINRFQVRDLYAEIQVKANFQNITSLSNTYSCIFSVKVVLDVVGTYICE